MSARRITEPPSVADAFNTTGDTILGLRPATPEWAENVAMQQSGLPPKNAREVKPEPAAPSAAPSEAPLPMLGVARARVGTEIIRLRAQAEAGRRELQSRFVFAANGFQISDPVVIEMRTRLAADIQAAEAEADRLDRLDDQALRQVAYQLGAR